jgi:6-phosphofructokinase 2
MPAPVTTVTVNPALDITAHARRVEADRKIRCTATRRHPGGGGINVARAVRLLGGEGCAVWTRGGLFGAGVGELLGETGIDHRPVDIEGSTRLSYAVIEDGTSRHFRFSGPGPAIDPSELDDVATAVEAATRDLLVISGGLPPGVPAAFYARLTSIAADAGARVIVDTHDEPLHAALGTGRVYVVKPNFRELFQAAGAEAPGDETDASEPDVVEIARGIVSDTGTGAVLVSLGAAGALLVTAERDLRIPAPTVPIRSKIGAGDSMVGGMAFRLAAGDDLEEAARYSVAAGTAAVMTPGTELCQREDTERLFAEM